MTAITKVGSASAHLFAGMWHPLVSVIIIMLQLFFSVECGVAHFLYVYSIK